MFSPFFVLFVWMLGCCSEVTSQFHRKRVDLAVDLSPHSILIPHLQMVNTLFRTRVVHRSENMTEEYDLVSFFNLKGLLALYQEAGRSPPQYIADAKSAQQMLEKDAAVRMLSTNDTSVRRLLAADHSATDGFTFSWSELESTAPVAKVTKRSKRSFDEFHLYGSAYKGRILSLRCIKRTRDDAHRPSGGGSAATEQEQWLPCGSDVVNAVSTILTPSAYTGVFSAPFKGNVEGRIQILPMHLGLTEFVASNDALFLSSIVPLAVGVAADSPGTTLHRKISAGAHNRAFLNIADYEAQVVLTGGGQSGDEWLDQLLFDPNAIVDPIAKYFTRERMYARRIPPAP